MLLSESHIIESAVTHFEKKANFIEMEPEKGKSVTQIISHHFLELFFWL